MRRSPSGVPRKRPLPLGAVYRLLKPGRVVLLTTAFRGRLNVMTESWHTMMEFEPPLIGCVVSEANHSFEELQRTRECVICIPTVEFADAVVGCGNTSGRTLEKFSASGLTAQPGAGVQAPRIAECRADLACPVVDAGLMSRYNFFVLQVLAAWYRPPREPLRTLHHGGRERFMIAGRTGILPSRAK